MSRPSNLSPDNILRFLQVRNAAVSGDEIISGLHLRKSDRRPLYIMLSKLKKRGAVTEIPGGRYHLGGRKGDADRRPTKGQTSRETVNRATSDPASQAFANQPRLPGSPASFSRDQATGRLVLH